MTLSEEEVTLGGVGGRGRQESKEGTSGGQRQTGVQGGHLGGGGRGREESAGGQAEQVSLCKPRPEASGEINPADPLVLDLKLQNCKEKQVCRLTLPPEVAHAN